MVNTSNPLLVAVIGVGLVGAELVDQILAQPQGLFQLVSLSSSKSTLFSASGLSLSPSEWSRYRRHRQDHVWVVVFAKMFLSEQSLKFDYC